MASRLEAMAAKLEATAGRPEAIAFWLVFVSAQGSSTGAALTEPVESRAEPRTERELNVLIPTGGLMERPIGIQFDKGSQVAHESH